jgi:hypothetical protein
MNKYNKLFLYSGIIVSLDILTTYIFLHMNCGIDTICSEGNPLAEYIINNLGFIGLTIVSAILLYGVYKYKPVLVYSFVIVNTYTTAGNILMIMRHI